jgi:hypothetical protein
MPLMMSGMSGWRDLKVSMFFQFSPAWNSMPELLARHGLRKRLAISRSRRL